MPAILVLFTQLWGHAAVLTDSLTGDSYSVIFTEL
jgi:hypothetical protein